MNSDFDYENFNFTFGNKTLTLEEIISIMGYKPEVSAYTMLGNCLTVAAYSLIIIVSLIGNILVCKVSFENPTTTNSLIASLAISDLLVTVFNIPLNVARLLMEDWPFGQFLCFFVPFVQVMAVYVSSFTMAVIAIHRYRSVTSTVTRTSCSKRQLWVTIIITWALSAVMAIPLSMFNRTQEVFTYKPIIRCRVVFPASDIDIALILTIECFLTQYMIPLSLACIIYGKIAVIISRQGKIANLRGNSKRRSDRKRRRILMLVLVVAVFAICWLPINFYHILVDSTVIIQNYHLFLSCHWFAMSSVCYNPFIYSIFNSTFRESAKNFFCFFLRCEKRPEITDIEERRRSSIQELNDTKHISVVANTPNINERKQLFILQESQENNCENVVVHTLDEEQDV